MDVTEVRRFRIKTLSLLKPRYDVPCPLRYFLVVSPLSEDRKWTGETSGRAQELSVGTDKDSVCILC